MAHDVQAILLRPQHPDEVEDPIYPVCYWCGEEEVFDILEVYNDREFSLETCCAELHEELVDELNLGAEGSKDVRDHIGEMLRAYGIDCRQVFNSWSRGQIVIDSGLQLAEISRKEARAFILDHHRHNPPPAGDRWRHAVYNGRELVAVAMIGRPVARMIDHTKVVEVNRLCVDHGLDQELTWKACSMLYGAAADEAKARGFEKIITYTLETERGMSLRYARWKKDGMTRGGTWNRPSRARQDKSPTCRKIRWAKKIIDTSR